ncbi:MAG: hypothetical protein LBF84_03770 [Holosporales bacterium]|jgi:hypothetical protein|nr:hypothetical protein [Holosporales bacterium]
MMKARKGLLARIAPLAVFLCAVGSSDFEANCVEELRNGFDAMQNGVTKVLKGAAEVTENAVGKPTTAMFVALLVYNATRSMANTVFAESCGNTFALWAGGACAFKIFLCWQYVRALFIAAYQMGVCSLQGKSATRHVSDAKRAWLAIWDTSVFGTYSVNIASQPQHQPQQRVYVPRRGPRRT